MGKMIDAQSIVVASVATDQDGQEGSILRYVFWHSLALACLVGVVVFAQAYWLTWMIPTSAVSASRRRWTMLELFKAKAEAVSAEVLRVPSPAAARGRSLRRARARGRGGLCRARAPCGARAASSRGPSTVARSPGAFPASPSRSRRRRAAGEPGRRVGVRLGARRHRHHRPGRDRPAPPARLDAHGDARRARPDRALLPDLECLLARVDPRRMRWLACVTGPSRTADIERVLTIGVHGPRRSSSSSRWTDERRGGADGGTGLQAARSPTALENGAARRRARALQRGLRAPRARAPTRGSTSRRSATGSSR